MGRYPETRLQEARAKWRELHGMVSAGLDPLEKRREDKQAALQEQAQAQNTFEKIALEWIAQHGEWADTHRRTIVSRLEKYIFPVIGVRPIAELERSDIMEALRPIEARGALELAKRVGRVCGQITDYACSSGYVKYDVGAGISKGLRNAVKRNFAAITEPSAFGKLLVAIEGYGGEISTCHCLRLLPYVFTRSGEIRGMVWEEVDWNNALWKIPAERMKMRREHIVPLSRQALGILASMKRFSGDCDLVFPSTLSRTRALSNVGLLNALRRLGYERGEMTVHGFRSSASTMLNEQGYNRDWVEMQLAHSDRNQIRGAYNRALYLPERRRMMQQWADYLDQLREQARLKDS